MASSGEMENLRTASLYINNQLLSRGLLRDGQSIDFANPACNEHGGLPAAMGRIMSVVNDLILKRDVRTFISPSFLSLLPHRVNVGVGCKTTFCIICESRL